MSKHISFINKILGKLDQISSSNSIPNPLDVNIVSPTPLPVEVTNELPYDFETVVYPNQLTNTYWSKIIRFDKVTGDQLTLEDNDTNVSVNDTTPKTDIEYREYCNVATSTIWVMTISHVIDPTGSVNSTTLSDEDTGRLCGLTETVEGYVVLTSSSDLFTVTGYNRFKSYSFVFSGDDDGELDGQIVDDNDGFQVECATNVVYTTNRTLKAPTGGKIQIHYSAIK